MIGLIVGVVVAFVLFVLQELRHPLPMLKLALFKNRNIALAFGIMFMAYGAMLGVISYLPFYFQEALGNSALVSGLKTMPRSVGFILGAIISSKLMDKGFRRLLCCAGVFVAVSSGLFGLLTLKYSYGNLVAFFILQGLGMGIQMPCATVLVQNSCNPQDTGTALSGFSFCGIIGGALFVAIYGSLYTKHLDRELGDLNPFNPMDREAWSLRAPQAITDGVRLVCMACMAPALLSSILAAFIVKFDIVAHKNRTNEAKVAVDPMEGNEGMEKDKSGATGGTDKETTP